ncbi:hypothetical protein CJA_1518 [Cellvibrio japonicus Ueda107]|uniref:Peptidase A2 domain-containing protein n=2 Tax=Cellvibrio japonicus TaxID=155077 RepID=B3PDQ8_CELJU|nr:hypothetical protein CJA_1518 [Cellvibrio japonicus Ueda107]QEI12063.1 hypothetical protein FY117_07380 [Cellvibrio japonicus]QEI15637.1 hypothetical protein FY116_07385 [Cellvibrio japonicus]QEI19215.1 hypothetical protein FY115_07380 [Cellvibrio japonicus]
MKYSIFLILIFCLQVSSMEVKKDIYSVGYELFTVQGYLYERKLNLVFDSGTNYTILNKGLIDEVKSSNKKIKKRFSKFLDQDILYANKVDFYLDKNYTHPSRIVFFDGLTNIPFEIDGILGFEYLYNIGFKVNFQDRILTLNPEEIYGNKIKIKVEDYDPHIEVIINNCKFSMAIDTGASNSSLKEDDWNRLMKCGSTELYKEDIYANNLLQHMHEKTIDKGVFEIKVGNSISNIVLYQSYGPLSNSNILGNDFLKDYEIIIPKKSKYIYLNKIEKPE